MVLMVAVVKIGLRPAEKRTDGRYRASFAVEGRHGHYAEGVLGVTRDISASGCSLLWPKALETGTQLPLRLYLGSQVADWTGEIMSEQRSQSDGWHVYGVRFVGLGTADVDLLNDSIFSLVIPDTSVATGTLAAVRSVDARPTREGAASARPAAATPSVGCRSMRRWCPRCERDRTESGVAVPDRLWPRCGSLDERPESPVAGPGDRRAVRPASIATGLRHLGRRLAIRRRDAGGCRVVRAAGTGGVGP
jgi:hypothetical protein